MSGKGRIPVALAALVLVAMGGASASGESERPGGLKEQGRVRITTTGSFSERIERLPITSKEGAEPRVAMSLSPRKLPALRRHDKLSLTSELQVTLNCNEREPRCLGDPYNYDPRMNVRLVLADSRGATRGLQIGPTKREVCRQRRPREHHCVITITGANTRIKRLNRLPCRGGTCTVNMVVDAHNPNATNGDELIIGGVKPNGSIPQDRGRINSILFRPANARYPRPHRTSKRRLDAIPLDLKRHVVYSQPIKRLAAGDQLAVQAAVQTSVAGLPYSVRTSSQLILATGENEVKPGPSARRIGAMGEISEANGFNCTRNRDTCLTRKVGVLSARRSAKVKGKFKPLYVNLVMIAGAKRVDAGEGDRYEVLKRGGLEVTRYPD